MSADLDHTWLVFNILCGLNGSSKSIQVVHIIDDLDMPAIGCVSLTDIFGKGEIGVSVNGDVVVVIQNDQLSWNT